MSKYDHELVIADKQTSFSKLLSHIQPDAIVLEFGCANGKMTKYLKEELDCKVYIVEIDEDAFSDASVYALNGVCGDIMRFEWLDTFTDISFDYVLFADVLEHLTDPASVIQKAVGLLKEAGEVLISVPNIAHSAVIINLINNKFEYKKIGLLDDTHIRFFTYASLQELLERCGLFPVLEDATYAAPSETEFKNNYSDIKGLADILMDRPYENVYQFIFKAVKKEYYYQNKDEIIVSKHIEESAAADRVCTIYLDTGSGFNDNEKLSLTFKPKENFFSLSFDLPPGVQAIRFDPVNDKTCVIKNLEVVSNNGLIAYENANGISMGNWDIFSNTGPQILISFKQANAHVIHISGTLYEYGFNMIPMLSKIVDAMREFKIQQSELQAVKRSYEDLTEVFDDLNSQYGQITTEHNELAAHCNAVTEERNALAAHCNAVTEERNALAAHYGVLTEQYHMFQQAFWWRVTKPARVLSMAIKRLLRSNSFTLQFYKILFYIRRFGVKATVLIIKNKISKKDILETQIPYSPLSAQELAKQKQAVFSKKIKFSILTPLYNTDKRFLMEMLASVKAQTYANWELCLADGSDQEHDYVEQICRQYAKKDKRILYKKSKDNKGISGNTNECFSMATGDYISFLDHDDLLTPDALYETMQAICEHSADFIYSDEDKTNEETSEYYEPHFKPDFAPDFLRANNYICHFVSVRREIVHTIGLLDPLLDGAQDFDFVLRAVEQAENILHIPKILYHWRAHRASTAANFGAKDYAIEAGIMAINRHLERLSLAGAAEKTKIPGIYRVRYKITGMPLVSIVIPNKDHVEDLDQCLQSIKSKSTYTNYEIIIVENNSTNEDTFQYYKDLGSEKNIKIAYYEGEFNYSKINNYGAKYANGAYIIFLNNDTEVITESWIEEMLMYAQREEVGIVGAKLYYPDLTVQHAGVVFTKDGNPHHLFRKLFTRDDYGYFARLQSVQNYGAVTGACLMIKKDLFFEIGGFYEELVVAFNDIDLCMRVREKGFLIVWTPFSELYHHEMKSRGADDTPKKRERHTHEIALFNSRWSGVLKKGDPYYNINLNILWED